MDQPADLGDRFQRKPSPIHYFFARDWPIKLYFTGLAIFGLGVAVSEWWSPIAVFIRSDPTMYARYCTRFVVSLVVMPLVFMALGVAMAFLVLGPIYYLGGRLAGAPFRVGDRVRILAGPHRDQVVEIYAIWEERRQIRVRLGEDAEKSVTDVFSFTKVFRVGEAGRKQSVGC